MLEVILISNIYFTKGSFLRTNREQRTLHRNSQAIDAIRRKLPEKWTGSNWILLHENIRPFRCIIFQPRTECYHSRTFTLLTQTHTYLFLSWLKTSLKGERFAEAEVLKQKATNAHFVKGISQNELQKCFEQTHDRWGKFVVAEREQFNGKQVF